MGMEQNFGLINGATIANFVRNSQDCSAYQKTRRVLYCSIDREGEVQGIGIWGSEDS